MQGQGYLGYPEVMGYDIYVTKIGAKCWQKWTIW